jgi:hypothetical protein
LSCVSVRAQLALIHGIDGRDRLDLELGRDELILVGVDLGQPHALRRIILRDLLDHRRQRLARPAPFRPEIDQHEAGHRRLDHVAAERLDGFAFGGAHSQGSQRSFLCLCHCSSMPPYVVAGARKPRLFGVDETGLADARGRC